MDGLKWKCGGQRRAVTDIEPRACRPAEAREWNCFPLFHQHREKTQKHRKKNSMKTTIPQNQNGVLAFALALYKGAVEHGITIGLFHITATIMLALRTAAVNARDLCEAGKLELSNRRNVLNEAFEAGLDFAALARDILKPTFGKQHNARWAITGFVDSLQMPESIEDLLMLLETLKNFFTANPTLEMGTVTAAQAQLMFDALSNANAALASQRTVLNNLLLEKDAKFGALTQGARNMINELATLMGSMDPRWLAFGLNKPGADETPEIPTNLSAILIGPTAAATKWDGSARAEYYRVWMKVHGSTADYVVVGSPADLDFTLENLPAGSAVDIAV